jgi:Spy/CpxP family protein refolding chaperone
MNTLSTRIRLAALGLALALPLHAAPPPGGPEGGPGCLPPPPGKLLDADHLPPHLQALDLSESQRGQIGELLKSQGPGLREKFEAGMKAHRELRRLSLSSDYPEDQARSLAESGAKTLGEAALAQARLDHAIYQLLSPAQQQQLKEQAQRMDSQCQAR